jgi:hypothetical protein
LFVCLNTESVSHSSRPHRISCYCNWCAVCENLYVGRAISRAAGRWPLTEEARVRAQASSRNVCGDTVILGQGLF